MKKKLICLFLALVMMFACASVLASCGDDPGDTACEHYDDNKDGKCDDCGKKLSGPDCNHTDKNGDDLCDNCGYSMIGIGTTIDYPWANQTLIFQFSENDNNRVRLQHFQTVPKPRQHFFQQSATS